MKAGLHVLRGVSLIFRSVRPPDAEQRAGAKDHNPHKPEVFHQTYHVLQAVHDGGALLKEPSNKVPDLAEKSSPPVFDAFFSG